MSPARSRQTFCARTCAISHDLPVHQPPACAKPLVDGYAEKPVLHDPEPGPASVRRRFGAQRFIFVLKPGQVSLDHDPFDEPGNAAQIHHGVKAHGVLPPGVATVGTAASSGGKAPEPPMHSGCRLADMASGTGTRRQIKVLNPGSLTFN